MPRSRKTTEDQKLNAFIGERVQSFRLDAGWNLEELAGKLGISAPHLKSLESGRYSFSAALLCKLAAAFDRPVSTLLPRPRRRRPEAARKEWDLLYDSLTSRDRTAVAELARNLAGGGADSLVRSWKQLASRGGLLISLEGVDGVVLDSLAQRTRALLERSGQPAQVNHYDFDSGLWCFIIERFTAMGVGPHDAFERTLLYACERLFRQETVIRPQLQAGKAVITQFFSMASSVYQRVERLLDTSLIDSVENFLLEPSLVVIVDSDPARAAERAVPTVPGPGQFFSPYRGVDRFRKARELHLEAAQDFERRGTPVEVLEVGDDIEPAANDLLAVIRPLLGG